VVFPRPAPPFSPLRLPVGKLVLFVCLSLADLVLTWHLLTNGEGDVYEGNPVARWWLERYGWVGLTFFKLGLMLFIVGVMVVVARHRPQAAGWLLVISCGILAAVVAYSGLLTAGLAVAPPAPGEPMPPWLS
jgi:Domain of unknown function (DUF5658)